MTEDILSYTIDPAREPEELAEVKALLATCGLDYEQGIEAFVVFRRKRRLIACAGLEKDIVKCAAIEPELRGESLALKLMTEVVHLAHERGYGHLFLFTTPDNVDCFHACGFYLLVEVPGVAALMENTPIGIRRYCDRLKAQRHEGGKIGAIVMNANPFTLGHRYLVEYAAAACDWLHVFVVAEDASLFRYRDRFQMVAEGIVDIPHLTVYPGSEYMVSRATFPSYFFKEKEIVPDCFTAIDLLLFRNYIVPALGITHRFVGTEPFCKTTLKYNSDMKIWLQRPGVSPFPPIEVVEIPRCTRDEIPISASEVRRLLRADDMERIRRLVPKTTLTVLETRYLHGIPPVEQERTSIR